MSVATSFVLRTSTPDTTGIVAAITGFLAERRLLITETQHFRDPPSNRSYLRAVFCDEHGTGTTLDSLNQDFAPVGARLGMQWEFHDARRRCRVLIAVSKQGHCLNSLLQRWSSGDVPPA